MTAVPVGIAKNDNAVPLYKVGAPVIAQSNVILLDAAKYPKKVISRINIKLTVPEV
jgi:hypothetical protein